MQGLQLISGHLEFYFMLWWTASSRLEETLIEISIDASTEGHLKYAILWYPPICSGFLLVWLIQMQTTGLRLRSYSKIDGFRLMMRKVPIKNPLRLLKRGKDWGRSTSQSRRNSLKPRFSQRGFLKSKGVTFSSLTRTTIIMKRKSKVNFIILTLEVQATFRLTLITLCQD